MLFAMPTDPKRQRLHQFTSLGDALQKVQRDRVFDDIAKSFMAKYIEREGSFTVLYAFFASAVARARGTREGIVREIAETNPHTVFPLLRQFAETVAVTFYVADHPEYAKTVATHARDRGQNTPSEKSSQFLASFMDTGHTENFKGVWDQLCDIAHFGVSAMWVSHRIDGGDDDLRTVEWSSAPRWRDEEQAKLACSLLLEVTDGMYGALAALGETLVSSA
jgi:hypothetical protein